MKNLKPYPEVLGTRSGHIIRYTCPSCIAESTLTSSSPKDHFKKARTVSCRHCKTRLNILTPGRGY